MLAIGLVGGVRHARTVQRAAQLAGPGRLDSASPLEAGPRVGPTALRLAGVGRGVAVALGVPTPSYVLVAFGVVAGLGSVVGYVQAFSAPETEPATTFTTNTEDAGVPAAERPAPASRKGGPPAAPGAGVDVSRRDPVPYSVSPPDVETPAPGRAPRTPASPGKRPGGPDAPTVSPTAPSRDAANRGREPGVGPSHSPGPRARPGHEADDHPHRLGGGRGAHDRPSDRDRSGHSPRPRFEQPVEALRPTRPEAPATQAPAPAFSAPTPHPAPDSAAGGRGRGHGA